MQQFEERYKIDCSPISPSSQTVVNGCTRLTVITPALIRAEVQENGKFCDEATQSVWFRDFCNTEFESEVSDDKIIIKTEKAVFTYSLRSRKMSSIRLSDGRIVTDYRKGNLKGTCRTLDFMSGKPDLGDGVCSKNGVAILDDSETLVMKDDGTILPRENKGRDEYYFAYGNDYIGATTDLYNLTGKVPLIPRYALSNWWSRYKAYTQKEYLTLMDRFKKEEIPVTVATVDMDWHWVDIKSKFGKDCCKPGKHLNKAEYLYDFISHGWTGYSFNTDLFPDHEEFLKKLKSDNYHITFNLHPSMGVRWFENQYEDMCKAMGYDPAEKKTVEFDITDKRFIKNYFDILHHPYEEKGVDFWWIDWQQGKKTKVTGLDPLWALNHYHFLDNARENHRPLILSRFCGAGSQRYPLGFSGDTTQTWKSLDYQPGFTATASNIAYPWWSHDIGGHTMGEKNDELYLRWVQLGVFSPIMRLHSSNNDFAGKEPWNCSGPVEQVAKDYLRFRHKLLPYIYTMNYRTHTECRAICEPMYYAFPKDENSYNCKNEFFFGSELIVAPVTEHTSDKTNLAGVDVWVPEGRYTDIFTGRIYKGNQFVKMYRDIKSIPVLAKEGAVIPMSTDDRTNNCSNPEKLELWVYRGNNTFTLYEDDGETLSYRNGEYLKTAFTIKEDVNKILFSIKKTEGMTGVVSAERTYIIKFKDVVDGKVTVLVNGKEHISESQVEETVVVTVTAKPEDTVEIIIENCTYLTNEDKKDALANVISKFQMSTNLKSIMFGSFMKKGILPAFVSKHFAGPINEILALYR